MDRRTERARQRRRIADQKRLQEATAAAAASASTTGSNTPGSEKEETPPGGSVSVSNFTPWDEALEPIQAVELGGGLEESSSEMMGVTMKEVRCKRLCNDCGVLCCVIMAVLCNQSPC